MRWIRRVLASIGRHLELLGRIEELEHDFEALRERMVEHEVQWVNQVDKLLTIHKRTNKRIQDGTAALAEDAPSVGDVKLNRAARLAALRTRTHGNAQGV